MDMVYGHINIFDMHVQVGGDADEMHGWRRIGGMAAPSANQFTTRLAARLLPAEAGPAHPQVSHPASG